MPQIYRAIRPMFKRDRWKICRDDLVYILSGPEKGKTGKVLEVFKDKRVPEVIVEGRNMRKKKVRTGPNPDDFFVVTMEAPLHYSQVALLDQDTQRPVRVVYMYTPEGEKVRVKKVPNPTVNDILPSPPEDPDPRAGLTGKKDTPPEEARKATYVPATGFPFRPRNLERIWASLHPDASPHGDDAWSHEEEDAGSEAGRHGRRRGAPALSAAAGLGGRGRVGGRLGLFSSARMGVIGAGGSSSSSSGDGAGDVPGVGGAVGGGSGIPGSAREMCTAAREDRRGELCGAGEAEAKAAAARWAGASFAVAGLRPGALRRGWGLPDGGR